MAQRNIDFGTFPDDPQADAIRTAFQKVQENFTEVYAGAVAASVSSVNRTPGAGITVSSPTGNVIVTANIACVQVHTSTLSIGRDSNGAQDTSITASSQTLWVDLPANISNVSNINLSGYATANGNITGGNIVTAGQVVATGNITGGNLNTSGTITAGNLSAANLSLTGNVSVTGNVTAGNISATSGAFTNVSGNGANLSSLSGANVSGQVANALVAGTVYTAAQPNITSVGTLTSLSTTGNITAGNNLIASNVFANSGTVRGNLLTGTLTTAAQPNITSVGTLTSLGVSGTVTAVAFTANTGVFTGNGSGLSAIAGANVTGTVANATYATSAGSATTAGTVTTAAQPNITSVGTLTSLGVSGAVTASTLVSNVATGTAPLTVTSTTRVSNLNVAYANVSDFINVTAPGTGTAYIIGANATSGNIAEYVSSGMSMNLATNAITATTFVGSLTGAATTAGTVTTAAQPNITSVGTLTGLTVTATITGNITGSANTATTATTAGTVTTNAQPNITSVGTLTGLTVTGTVNTSGASNVTLGNLSNIRITGGASGYTIKTDGAGNLSWGVDTAAAGGSNTQVQFNDGGSLGASANYTFDKTTNVLTLSGNLQTSNANLGNAATANYFIGNFYGRANTANTVLVAAQPNITSLGTLTSLTVSGGVANLGVVANVKILGGSGYLYNDSSNNLTYQSVVTQSIPGAANTVLLSSGSNNIIASGNIKFDDPQLSITGTLNVSGNANVGNIGATNIVGTIATASQPNITSVGTLTSLTVGSAGLIVSGGGNINAGNVTVTNIFSGNGSGLSAIVGANVTGQVSFAATANAVAGANVSGQVANALVAGTVYTNAQPNITSVGTLTSLGVNGTITGVNITANTGVFTGNANGLTSIPGANVSGAVSSATSATNASALLQNTSTSTSVYPTFTTSSANGNSQAVFNTSISANLGNASITATTFVGALSGAATSATTAGTVTTNAQPNITSVGTLTSLGVNGTVTAVAFTANTGVFTGNGSGLSSLAGANVTGAVSFATTANSVAGANVSGAVSFATTANSVAGANVSGTVSSATTATTAGTVTTAAQPNITSVGTLTSLTSSGNITGANLITTGYQIRSVATGITAAGTTQGAATAITRGMNIVTTVTSGANSVVLPTAVAGMVLTITNTNANVLNVFPASGAAINTLAANASFSLGTTTIQFIAPTSTQWYTVGATYA